MRNKYIYLGLLSIFSALSVNAQTYLTEGFETGNIPTDWTQEYESGIQDWRYRNGGHNPSDDNWSIPADAEDIARNPASAYEGTYNAIFFQQGFDNEKTKLVTKPLNLDGAANVELSFYLCQIPWTFAGSTAWDILRIYYKSTETDPWTLLHEYVDPVYDWEQQKLILPGASDTYYLAFEGHSRWGYGTCIDEIIIEEIGSTPMYLDKIEFFQPFTKFIPSGSSDVPLLRTDLRVLGNTDAVMLQEMEFVSLNTLDDDLVDNSLRLYITTTQVFNTENPIGIATSFENGKVTFTGLNDSIPRGSSYIWLAGDIDPGTEHENVIDVEVQANSIMINGQTYPSTNQNTLGERIVYSTLYSQNYDGVHNWTLTGEFEIDSPTGDAGETGNPNPPMAHSGSKSMGTDITGKGSINYCYEPNLNDASSYLATSPAIDALYYQNLHIFIQRYLNVGANDKASIEVSTDNGVSWEDAIWENVATISDFEWTAELLKIPEAFSKTAELKIRFKLGPTNSTLNYTGWNVDDFFLTGEFISKDVGVTEWVRPQSGSGHTATDSVTLKIKNYGGANITDPVPVAFSLNGGDSWTVDYMAQEIPIGGEVNFTFPTTVDLSIPGLYPDVIAKTFFPGDQDLGNDQLMIELFIVPTHTPPHEENFDQNDGYWKSSGNMWEHGKPAGVEINQAYSDTASWMTYLDTDYGVQITGGNYVLFEDGFETDAGWTFEGEFERGIPDVAHPPYSAYWNGQYCIGTDYTGVGSQPFLYENNINEGIAYTATSPAINVADYINLQINFARVIDILSGDSVRIEVSPDNTNWTTIWQNDEGAIDDWDWQFFGYDIPDSLTKTETFRIRFSLFYSNSSDVAEGISIDEFSLTGDLTTIEPGYLDSPTYNLSGIVKPILEAKVWSDTEEGVDGVTLYYSLDEGANWTAISNASGFDTYWNWYTGHPVSALGLNGWSGQSGDWITVKHTLPAAVINQENVKFRWKFISDKSNNIFDGIAIDDVKLYEAPFDAGVESILSPITSCELGNYEKFTIRVKNYGSRLMQPGDTLVIGYHIDKEGVVQTNQEDFILSQSLAPGASLDLNLNSGFDFSESGSYTARVYTIDSHPLFYSDTPNDEKSIVIDVNKPYVDLGPDISTISPENVVLDAYTGDAGDSYEWQDGSINSTFNVPSEGTYSVKVTNALLCEAVDTIKVLLLVVDVGVGSLTGVESDCESGVLPVQISIHNFGTDTLEVDDTILIFGKIKQTLEYSEQLILSDRFYPGDSISYTFAGNYDFSTPGSYPMKLYTQLNHDDTYTNDTLFYPMEVHGYPDIDLGADTIVYAAEYILDPGIGYFEYLWQDGSGLETFIIDEAGSGTFYVTVSDAYQCSSQDTVDVTLNIKDVVLDEILSPGSGCDVSNTITVSSRIRNNGNEPIPSGQSIIMGYTLDGGPEVEESLLLDSDFESDSTLDFIFTNSEDVVTGEWYDFVIYVEFTDDTKLSNDTIYKTVGVFETPNIDLGDSYQVISALEHTLDAGAGFLSYEWQDGSTNQTFTISEPGIGIYGVTVVDGNNCTHYEEVQILMIVPDIGVTDLLSPESACDLSTTEQIQVEIKNFGTETIDPGADIKVTYSINNSESIIESVDLEAGFEGGSVIYHTFSVQEDFSPPDQYHIVANTIYDADLIPANDIILEIVDVLGSPVVDIGNGEDTIFISEATTLSVESGYLLYEWQDGSTNFEYNITDPSAEMYTVKVTGGNGCITKDSVLVIYDIPNLAIQSIASPLSSCELGSVETVAFEIANEGYFRISKTDTITLAYSINDGSSVFEIVNLSSQLLPGESRIIPFSTTYDFSAIGEYKIQAVLFYGTDTDTTDNLMVNTISVYGYPEVQIGDGSDTLKTDLPYNLTAQSGFSSYLWQNGAIGNAYEVTSYGWYKVIATDDNGCFGSDSVLVIVPVSIQQMIIGDGEITIYPNPVKDFFHVIIETEDESEISLELYNMLNALIYKEEITHSNYTDHLIDVQSLSPGTYFLHINYMDASIVYLVVVIE